MANGYNKVILIGNLGDEPQMRTAANGTTIANFSLAINEFRRNPQTGENSDYTEWVRCVAFGRTAETIGRYLHKGSQVHVEGKIRTSSYEKDGQRRYSTEVVLDPTGLIMLGSRQQNQDGYYNSNRQNYGQRNDGEIYGSGMNGNSYNNQNSGYNRSNSQGYNRNPQRQNYNSQNYSGYNSSSSPYGSQNQSYNSGNSYDSVNNNNNFISSNTPNSYAQANSANSYSSQNNAFASADSEKNTSSTFEKNTANENTNIKAPVAEKASDLKEPIIQNNNDDDLPF